MADIEEEEFPFDDDIPDELLFQMCDAAASNALLMNSATPSPPAAAAAVITSIQAIRPTFTQSPNSCGHSAVVVSGNHKKMRQLTLFECSNKNTGTGIMSIPVHQNRPESPRRMNDNPQSCNHHAFDRDAVKSYIYPTNYPIRDYQYNICRRALFTNTLVALPTGLGKTFIAAVIMYNYYRWFPNGKIIFMAPTKPLVSQQIEACFNITAIPQPQTAMITGDKSPETRVPLWRDKRMFFITPQVLQNDLQRGTVPVMDIVCLVLDEAHKATGQHAYCETVREIMAVNPHIRILALSATPGTDIKKVQLVIDALHISQVEIRHEDSLDITPYTHSRKETVIVVPLGDSIKSLQREYCTIALKPFVDRLISNRALYAQDPMRFASYTMITERAKWRLSKANSCSQSVRAVIEGDFALLITLYKSFENLYRYGVTGFHK